jgi:acetylornithine aminotransferase
VPLQEQLAAKLASSPGLSKAFFCSTGLEANEAALKIARKYATTRASTAPEIIVYEKAFHGRSIATLSATGNTEGAGRLSSPLVEGFVRRAAERRLGARATAATRTIVAVFLKSSRAKAASTRHQSTTCASCADLRTNRAGC